MTLQQRTNASQGRCVVQLRSGVDSSELLGICVVATKSTLNKEGS